jgi:hypothetical protein
VGKGRTSLSRGEEVAVSAFEEPVGSERLPVPRAGTKASTYPSALSGNPQQGMEIPGDVGAWSPG